MPDDAAAERRRRERALRLLGETMPGTTSDERGPGWGREDETESSRDAEMRRDVPPHHG
ncbi:hypothetical protein [Solicola sp. PLA-1-18]|uniref:hypothetical protein n=1 Tax=Solicola sp. PLA-1-18 TaxID=3380532 RepID=UPI003B7D5E42